MTEKLTTFIPPAALAVPNGFVIEEAAGEGYAKTHQAVGGRYMKECSLTDKSTWSAVAVKKEDADFKILRITNSPTVSAALDFMQQAEFYETFNQASHWFFIVIEVDDGSELASEAVGCLAEVLDEQKPVIIQWDFMDSAEHFVFFKQTGQSAFTQLQMNSASLFSTEDELILNLTEQGSFHLPLLLNALRLGVGGQVKGDALDLLNVSFDVNEEISTWRLIDYAARDDESLLLRFLLLVDWDLAHLNGDGRRTLEIAAEFGGPLSISALLNLPMTSSAEQLFLSEKKKNLLALASVAGDNPLLIAAQKKPPDTLKYLIRCNIDLHCHRTNEASSTAVWLAWNKKLFENMHVLLEADSPFPHDFDLRAIEKNENMAALLKQVEDRQRFHQAIKEGSQHVVQEFIKCYPRLKRAYDCSNQSALMTALEAGQYELYALLQSEGLCAGKNEQLSVVLERLTSEQKCRLKEANLKYFGKQDDSHIIYLLSKSRLVNGQENKKNFGTIRELYEQLDAIPEISTILKVVEHCEVHEIIFDFDSDSIVNLDPTQSSGTKGSCNYGEGRLYVSGQQESELLGTLAHELTHLAMHVCYDNDCNPYEESDEGRKSDFNEIVSQYHEKKGMDSIIEQVFTVYEESSWPSELIVRVLHLLARYSGEQDRQLVTQQAPELFHFYEQNTQEDLKRFIENPTHFKVRHQIQHLNTSLGRIVKIEQSRIWLNDTCLLNDEVLNCLNVQILSSPLPQLTIMNLYQVIRRKQLSVSDIKGGYIFVAAEQFRNQAQAKSVFQAFQSVTHPTLIIDCSREYYKSETDLWSTINSFREKRKIIFIAVSDVAQSLQDKLKKYHVTKIQYKWSDLDRSSQNALLERPVHFQGNEMPLKHLISADSKLTDVLPLADLLGAETLEIGEPMRTQNPLPYPPENVDKFLQQAHSQKVMLISGNAGMGKTTVLTHLSKQIKEKFPTYWVVEIYLTNHTEALEAQAEAKRKLQAIDLLSEKLVKLKSPLEKELFKQYLEGLEKTKKIVLMFDGFDEISPNYKEIVMDLLQALNPIQQPSIEQMWVTTRPHLKGELEENLQNLSYTLDPISEENQVMFLSNLWLKKSQELDEQRSKIYAEALINELTQSICDREKHFTGIPLHMHMLAEAFYKKAGIFCLSLKSEPEVRREFCLVDLYKKFITDKLFIFRGKGKIATDQQSETDAEDISITRNHQKLAFKILFPEVGETLIKLEASELLSCENISRIGIVQYIDDKPYFIHCSFAEYYVAEFLVKKFTRQTNVLSELQQLFHRILMEAEFQVIRLFMDGFLLKSKPSDMNLREYGKQIYKMWEVEHVNSMWEVKQNQLTRAELRRMFHQAAKEGNFHIIGFLLDSLTAACRTWGKFEIENVIKDLLLHRNSDGETVWHLAAQGDHINTSEVVRFWTEALGSTG